MVLDHPSQHASYANNQEFLNIKFVSFRAFEEDGGRNV